MKYECTNALSRNEAATVYNGSQLWECVLEFYQCARCWIKTGTKILFTQTSLLILSATPWWTLVLPLHSDRSLFSIKKINTAHAAIIQSKDLRQFLSQSECKPSKSINARMKIRGGRTYIRFRMCKFLKPHVALIEQPINGFQIFLPR